MVAAVSEPAGGETVVTGYVATGLVAAANVRCQQFEPMKADLTIDDRGEER
jgi:hypothetical protein